MPFWESRKRKDERLFKESLHAMLRPLEGAASLPVEAIWLMAGSVAADVAVSLNDWEGLKKAWGRGEERKARTLTAVFALPALSAWHRQTLPPEYSDDVRRRGCETAASNVLALCGNPQECEMEDFLKMDTQYNAELDDSVRVPGTPALFHTLVATQAELACAGQRLDLSNMSFPTDSLGYVAQGGYREPSGMAFLFAAQALESGLNVMWRLCQDLDKDST